MSMRSDRDWNLIQEHFEEVEARLEILEEKNIEPNDAFDEWWASDANTITADFRAIGIYLPEVTVKPMCRKIWEAACP